MVERVRREGVLGQQRWAEAARLNERKYGEEERWWKRVFIDVWRASSRHSTFDEIATTVQISSPMHDQLHRPGGPELFVNGKRDSTRAFGPVASWSKASPDPNCLLQTLATQRLDPRET